MFSRLSKPWQKEKRDERNAGNALAMQSTAASQRFNWLTPGVPYTIAVNAVGAADPSDWSNPASLFAD